MSEQDKRALEIIKRILCEDDNYINPNHGNNKFYIDGCTEFKSKEEKEFLIEWLRSIGATIWED